MQCGFKVAQCGFKLALFWVREAPQCGFKVKINSSQSGNMLGFESAPCSVALKPHCAVSKRHCFGFLKLRSLAMKLLSAASKQQFWVREAARCGLRSRVVRPPKPHGGYSTPGMLPLTVPAPRGWPGNLIYRNTCKIS